MLLDYLRYLAFVGRLRPFFEDDAYRLADHRAITGLHLRYADDFVVEMLDRYEVDQVYRGLVPLDEATIVLERALGVRRMSQGVAQYGDHPPVAKYDENREPIYGKRAGRPRVEIIVDIHPKYWTERFTAGATFGEDPVIFRQSGPALGAFSSGDRLSNREDRRDFGTLCMLVHAHHANSSYALTCAHVVRGRGGFDLGPARSPYAFWRRPATEVGYVWRAELIPASPVAGTVAMAIDAALLAVPRIGATGRQPATIRAIATMRQEEKLVFQGAARGRPTQARVSAVTIRKSMDLFRDGTLIDLGDLLYLGQPQKMYFPGPLTRPGDSGAAVRGQHQTGTTSHDWHGMILGGSDEGGFATHAEFLTHWARHQLNDQALDFYFD